MTRNPFLIEHVNFIHGEKKIDIKKKYGNKAKLIEKTGIPQVWETSMDAYSLAIKCLKDKTTLASIKEREITGIIYVTQSPRWYLPAHSCRIQSELNLPTNITGFDLNQGCSGFVQGLSLASRLVQENKTIILVTTDTYREKLDEDDLATQVLFSDGASVTLVTGSLNGYTVLAENTYTNGEGSELLQQEVGSEYSKLTMKGYQIREYGREAILPTINEVIKQAGLTKNEINTGLLHQASLVMIQDIVKDLTSNGVKTPINLNKYGNTTSSSIPSLMYDGYLPKINEKTLLSGFGVGFTISNMILGN